MSTVEERLENLETKLERFSKLLVDRDKETKTKKLSVGGDADISGDLNVGGIIAGSLKAGSINRKELANDAVTADKIGNGEVGESELADNAVTEKKIGNEQVGTDKLANNAVTEKKIGNGQVGTDKLANNAVIAAKIGDRQVTNAKLENLALERLSHPANSSHVMIKTPGFFHVKAREMHFGRKVDSNLTGHAFLTEDGNNLVINRLNHFGEVKINKFASGSSASWKTDITDLTLAEAERLIDQLKPRTFRAKRDEQQHYRVGFIAEETPFPLSTAEKDALYLDGILSALVAVVKEMRREIIRLTEANAE